MKKVKKLLALLLAVMMLGTPAAFADNAADETTEDTAGTAAAVIVVEVPSEEDDAAAPDAEEPADPAGDEAAAGDAEEASAAAEAEADPAEQAEDEKEAAETPDSQVASEKTDGDEEEAKDAAAASNYVSQQSGELSGKTIQIQSWDCSKMATNSDYSYLKFTFCSADDSTTYEAYIAGISFRYSARENETTDDQVYDVNKIYTLLTDVADSFYAGKSIVLSDSKSFSGKYGLVVQPIDAEKVHNTGSTPNTDKELCWAASASDMLQLTGWNKVAGDGTLTTEDKLFDYFESSFTDNGSSQEYGTKWFFDGTFPTQTTDPETGKVIYGSTAVTTSQEKLNNGETDGKKNGGLLSEYAEETVENNYLVRTDGYEPLYDAATKLQEGYATGLGIYFYNDEGERGGGHAVTLMGYLRNTLQQGWESVKSLFIVDSDNNKFESSTRDGMVDSVTMFELTEGQVVSGGSTVQAAGLKGYSSTGTYYLLDYCTLAPYSDTVAKETDGLKDAVNMIDYSVTLVDAETAEGTNIKTATVGDTISLCTGITNSSYYVLPLVTSLKPYVGLTYTISCNGQVVDTINKYSYLVANTDIDQHPNATNYFTSSNAYTLKQAGNYTVSVKINGIYYDDTEGKMVSIPEAYTSNNTCRKTYSFTVEAAPETPVQPAAEPEQAAAATPAATQSRGIQKTAPTYPETITSGEITDTTVTITAAQNTALTITLDGKAVSTDSYKLAVDSTGAVTITFTKEFLSTLLPGTYIFSVSDASGTVIAYVKLTIM